jgi:dihydrofolate synthase/folylpolyglutamate synthase
VILYGNSGLPLTELPTSLAQWLNHISAVHPVGWDLGLERVGEVGRKLDLLHPAKKVVLVAGTNGKGSTCEYLTRLALAAGLKTGTSTSPHLHQFNERIALNGTAVDDDLIVSAFNAIEAGRGETSLTYFEFAVLASLLIFKQANVDIAILEIGLGGRLDAMNIVDADLSIIMSIALDHESWLGDTRIAIGREKAGIMRPSKPCLIADRDPPESLLEVADAQGTPVEYIGTDFELDVANTSLSGDSFAAAHRAAEILGFAPSHSVKEDVARVTQLPGRRTWIPGDVPVLLDVAHNPAAAAVFAGYVAGLEIQGQIHALVGMYADKDIERVLSLFRPLVKTWHLTDMDDPRAESAAGLVDRLAVDEHGNVHTYANIASACRVLHQTASAGDLIIVFGSFPIVAGALSQFEKKPV